MIWGKIFQGASILTLCPGHCDNISHFFVAQKGEQKNLKNLNLGAKEPGVRLDLREGLDKNKSRSFYRDKKDALWASKTPGRSHPSQSQGYKSFKLLLEKQVLGTPAQEGLAIWLNILNSFHCTQSSRHSESTATLSM